MSAKKPLSSPLGCKLLRKRPHSCSASQRQPVLRLPMRATGSQLSLRVITYKLLAVEWRVKYGHRPYSVSTRQQVNWPRRPLKIWACNISSDWICIKAPLFCPPHHLFVLKLQEWGFLVHAGPYPEQVLVWISSRFDIWLYGHKAKLGKNRNRMLRAATLKAYVNVRRRKNKKESVKRQKKGLHLQWEGCYWFIPENYFELKWREMEHIVNDMHSLASYMWHLRAHWLNEI